MTGGPAIVTAGIIGRSPPTTPMNASTACLALALLALTAHAQVPPRPLAASPDDKAFPELASMKRFLETGSPQARHCALTGGLYLDADRSYRETRSEAKTVEAVMRPNAEKLNAAERDRLRSIVVNVTSLAVALNELDADSAAVAFSQMCIGRARRPGVEPAPDTIRFQFERSYDCQRRFAANTLERKECVAQAFRMP